MLPGTFKKILFLKCYHIQTETFVCSKKVPRSLLPVGVVCVSTEEGKQVSSAGLVRVRR